MNRHYQPSVEIPKREHSPSADVTFRSLQQNHLTKSVSFDPTTFGQKFKNSKHIKINQKNIIRETQMKTQNKRPLSSTQEFQIEKPVDESIKNNSLDPQNGSKDIIKNVNVLNDMNEINDEPVEGKKKEGKNYLSFLPFFKDKDDF